MSTAPVSGDVWSYRGMECAIFGCHSGMGEATARELVRLGATVHGFDIKPGPEGLASFHKCDLRKTSEIDAALATISGPVNALFYCAGLPQTFPGAEVLAVNFLSPRYLIEKIRPKMAPQSAIAVIASTAGNGYVTRLDTVRQLTDTPDFASGAAWVEKNLAAQGDPYMFSKEAMLVWGLMRSETLIAEGIRLNILSPGPTDTVMMDAFESVSSAKIIDVYTAPINRRSTVAEQAYPLIFLNSRAASYINGLNLIADGGFTTGMAFGLIDLDRKLKDAMV